MQNFENKLLKIEQTLNNIRGYLWKQQNREEVKRYWKGNTHRKFLEKSN